MKRSLARMSRCASAVVGTARRQPHDVGFGDARVAEQDRQHRRVGVVQQPIEHLAPATARQRLALAEGELAIAR
jgi:hypothetical protein